MREQTVYIVLFRGVGGNTQLPTALLRAALSDAGFDKVATYINSGNAVLRSELGCAEARRRVQDIVARAFGFEKAVYLATGAEWEDVVARNPFPEALAHPRFLQAAWLAAVPEASCVERVSALASPGEGFAVRWRVAYLHTPAGMGTSRMAERFDRAIGVENTARNWNTVLKLAELARLTRLAEI